jgi:hypothetical protein
MQRPISTRTHGVLDYVTGSALLVAPELFRLRPVRRSARVPRLAGTTSTAYSLLTDYELGAVRLLPMRAHLALDAFAGALLAVSPWALGTARFGRRHWLPHVLVGAGELAVAFLTRADSPPGEAESDSFSSVGMASAGAPAQPEEGPPDAAPAVGPEPEPPVTPPQGTA